MFSKKLSGYTTVNATFSHHDLNCILMVQHQCCFHVLLTLYSHCSWRQQQTNNTYCQWIPQGSDDFDIRRLHKFNYTKRREKDGDEREDMNLKFQLLDNRLIWGWGSWQTWGGDGGRRTHIWALEHRMFEAHRSSLLWKLLRKKRELTASSKPIMSDTDKICVLCGAVLLKVGTCLFFHLFFTHNLLALIGCTTTSSFL